jgi:protocatechuate 3,4-dioxygenase, beta subunit
MKTPAAYRRPYVNTQPDYLFPKYASTVKRAPAQPLVVLPHTLSEVTAPVFGHDDVKPSDADLTKQHEGDPQGERIVVSGRVLDENSRPMPNVLIEIWQANAGATTIASTSTMPPLTRTSPAPAEC